jgi:hypothetical protein
MRIPQYMAEQHHALGQALGTRRAHVVAGDLLEEDGAIPARRTADAADDADEHRQDQELRRIQATAE